VSQKSIPDIFDCNLKTNYQILIIFDTATLGEVGNWTVIWWQVMSGIFVLKLSKSVNWFSSYSRKCRGCFFKTQCMSAKCWLWYANRQHFL